MDTDLLTAIITGVIALGGGLAGGTYWRGRSEARKIDTEADAARAKLPAEVDSVVIQNAEQALAMQLQVNLGVVAENVRLHAEIARKDQEIQMLHGTVDTAYATIEGLRVDLTEAHRFGHELLRKLSDADARYTDLIRQRENYEDRPQQ